MSDAFSARFPYQETDDQLKAIEDVIADLTAGTPMDRLVCGDAGFGKTEVAMRASFLVAMQGRQVAILVPTTVLAQQHRASFRQRFAGYPVRIESLSRFTGRREIAAVLDGLKKDDGDPDWDCEKCGRPNPGTFDWCWNCARDSNEGVLET